MVLRSSLALLGLLCVTFTTAIIPQDASYRHHSINSGRRTATEHARLNRRVEQCEHSVSSQRAVAYYEGWASRRSCNPFYPSDIDVKRWTHINFAFAVLDKSGKIIPSSKGDVYLYNQTTALRKKNKELQVWIAVGGDGMGGKLFSEMVSSNSSRRNFIQSAKRFMHDYDFDGIDIDWEYPTVVQRGGQKSDKRNLVKLVKEMRKEFGSRKGISVTIPARSYYLDGFDLKAMQSDLNMINFMSYDLNGYWDRPLLAAPGTNLTEIDTALQRLKDERVSMQKLNLGLAYYGYSYTLANSSCTEPGCPAVSAGKFRPCGEAKGTLDIGEIQQIIANYSIKPTLNKEAAVMYFSWGNNSWVSYDNDETLQMKTQFARDNCLGGSFVWAVDMESPKRRLDPTVNGGSSKSLNWYLLVSCFFCMYLILIL